MTPFVWQKLSDTSTAMKIGSDYFTEKFKV